MSEKLPAPDENIEHKAEVKFPFEPSEKVKAAFRQQRAYRRAVELMTQAMLESAMQIETIDPFRLLGEEHPETRDVCKRHNLQYNQISQMIEIRTEKRNRE